MSPRLAWLAMLPALALWMGAAAEPIRLDNQHGRLALDSSSGQLVEWRVCYRDCVEGGNPLHRQDLDRAGPPIEFDWPAAAGEWRVVSRQSDRVELERTGPGATPVRLSLQRQGRYRLWLELQADAGLDPVPVRLRVPAVFDRGTSYGFAASHEMILAYALAADGWQFGEAAAAEAADWVGFRNRFWTVLARFENAPDATWRLRDGIWQGRLRPGQGLALYAGPITLADLAEADPALSTMMFDGLWFWLRWLSFGLLALLNGLYALIGHWGLAVLALSLVVKILMTPLNLLADRWQAQVNRIQSQLQPEIDRIKRTSKGEEQANRILAAHKDLGVTPFYTLKSAFGFLIQIPVFIAAFNVLNEAIGLSGASFLWIDDLARPDHFLALPFAITFFGDHLNLMPFIMTAVTILASWHFDDDSLSPQLRARQQRNLYWMALLFFVLFYTFPAGMVMYWTMNNVLQYLKDSYRRLRRPPPSSPAGESGPAD